MALPCGLEVCQSRSWPRLRQELLSTRVGTTLPLLVTVSQYTYEAYRSISHTVYEHIDSLMRRPRAIFCLGK